MVAEKKSDCRLCGKSSNDPFYIMDKTHVEHAVGFIKDKNFNIPQRDESLVHQVEQAARSGD